MVLGIVAAVGGVIGIGASHNQARKGAKKQNQASKVQQKMADNQAANERRRQIRQARIMRGRMENVSAATGGRGSSSEASAEGGITSGLGFNLSESFITQQLAGQATGLQRSAANYAARAASYSAIGGVASSLAISGVFSGAGAAGGPGEL